MLSFADTDRVGERLGAGMHRRKFLASGMALATGAPARMGLAQDDAARANEFASTLLLTGETTDIRRFRQEGLVNSLASQFQPYLAEYEEALAYVQREKTWDISDRAIHYAHLAAPFDAKSFPLTHDVLETLRTTNSFAVADSHQTLLFGLRGCELMPPAADGTLMVREQVPDHYALRCIIGVWRREEKSVAAFSASTVPNVSHLFAHQKGIMNANLLPTGLHLYVVGYHILLPGAFRQSEVVPVLRVKRVPQRGFVGFSSPIEWDPSGLVGDNIHPAYLDLDRIAPFYSSAGCQVIGGTYRPGQGHVRDWAQLRRLAGLTDNVGTRDHGKTYPYMLLMGREARLAAEMVANRQPARLTRLRFGSSGLEVASLQASLGIKAPDAKFGSQTMMALIRWQGSRPASGEMLPDGIATLHNTREWRV